jgi:hypothetical protein
VVLSFIYIKTLLLTSKKQLESFPKNVKVAYLFNFFSVFNHCLENFQGVLLSGILAFIIRNLFFNLLLSEILNYLLKIVDLKILD